MGYVNDLPYGGIFIGHNQSKNCEINISLYN